MSEVQLRPVTFAELSDLRHEVAVADGLPHQAPEFLIVRYFGTYRDGAAGRGDALYIVATAAAARKGWWSPSTILDFRELAYSWGDEMEWIAQIGWDPGTRLNWPLAVVVSDKCGVALRSLLQEEYEGLCVESMDEAFDLCRRKAQEHERRLRQIQGSDRT
jgi:hypothetical protein